MEMLKYPLVNIVGAESVKPKDGSKKKHKRKTT